MPPSEIDRSKGATIDPDFHLHPNEVRLTIKTHIEGDTAWPSDPTSPDEVQPVKMRRKSDLPVKTCIACGRPMVWRKAWARVWDEVRYCSDGCRKRKGDAKPNPVPTR